MPEPRILDLFTLFGPVPPRGVAEPGTERLRTVLTRHNVAGAITLSTRGIYHSAPAGNRETVALCGESGGMLQPAGVLDPRLPNAADSLAGVSVICLLPVAQNWPVRFAPLVQELQTLTQRNTTLPLLIETRHIGDATAARDVVTESGYRGPIVLIGVNGDTLIESLAVARQSDKYHIGTYGLRGVGEIAAAVSALGPERVIFASAAPVRTLGGALRNVHAAGLTENDAALVLGGNVLRLIRGGSKGQTA